MTVTSRGRTGTVGRSHILDAMRPWLRVGRRLEYSIGALTIAELIAALIFASWKFPNPRWMGWLIMAGFILPFNFVAWLVGWWVRRIENESSTGRTSNHRQIATRLIIYGVTALMIPRTALILAKATGWNVGVIVFWDFAIFAGLILVTEISQRRKKRSLQ